MIDHDCDNDVSKLLNPCIEELLSYNDLLNRVIKVEESFHDILRKIKSGEKSDGKPPYNLSSWADMQMIYQLPNKEFIYEFAHQIKKIKPDIILEVGAGKGIICKHLSKILDKKIILTDSYDWWNYNDADVLKRTYQEAIEEFKPDLIIVSWIPYHENWSKDFRKYPFVKGYIIIGEKRGGATGCDKDWKTDWKIQNLNNVTKYGICKTDYGCFIKDSLVWLRHSNVTYFERS